MKLGVTLMQPATSGATEWCRIVNDLEASGIDRIGVGDVQTLSYECYVYLGMLALESKRVTFGPVVSNPVSRHVGVVANAFATLREISGGRVFLGIGSGNSALRNIGEKPASLASLREHILAFRRLLADGHATVGGLECELPWATAGSSERVPVYVAANGPKSLRLAGEIADGVICGGGISDDVLDMTLKYIDEGANRVGRSVHDLDIWCQIDLFIGSMDEPAWEREANILAAKASRNFRSTLEGKGVPPEMVGAIRQLETAYAYDKHVAPGSSNAKLLDDLGLTDFLAERWLLQGNVPMIVERLDQLAALGVNGVHTSGFAMGLSELTISLKESLVPALQSHQGAS